MCIRDRVRGVPQLKLLCVLLRSFSPLIKSERNAHKIAECGLKRPIFQGSYVLAETNATIDIVLV